MFHQGVGAWGSTQRPQRRKDRAPGYSGSWNVFLLEVFHFRLTRNRGGSRCSPGQSIGHQGVWGGREHERLEKTSLWSHIPTIIPVIGYVIFFREVGNIILLREREGG